MNCSSCHEPVQPGWFFCRACGTALAPVAGGAAVADKSVLDATLSALLAAGQSGQAGAQSGGSEMGRSDYLGYLDAGIVPHR